MKKLFLTMFLAASSICMMGQTRVIKGYVVDKKTGNYLPGAEVAVKGGAESTTTDADGSFSLEVGLFAKKATARYAGMVDKKLRIRDKDMVFRMKKDKGFWFLNFMGGFVSGPAEVQNPYSYIYDISARNTYSSTVGHIGLIGGYLSKWGFYGKFTINPWGEEILPMGSAGVTKRIFPWLHASLGLGVGLGLQNECYYYYSLDSYSYPYNPSRNYTSYWNRYGYIDADSKIQIMPEIGLIFRISKHLTANIHYGIGICTGTSYNYSPEPYSYIESYLSPYSSSDSYDRTHTSYSFDNETAGLNHNFSVGFGYAF
jgi:hypothetical protein